MIVQAALNESAHIRRGITVSLFDGSGQCMSRLRAEDSSRTGYTWSQLKFNYLNAHGWSAKHQCHPANHICAFLTRFTMPFTHRVALPGAVLLQSGGNLKGVLAISGGTDQQNHDIAAKAVKAAGYSELGESHGTFEK